jgi:hypothetical protein
MRPEGSRGWILLGSCACSRVVLLLPAGNGTDGFQVSGKMLYAQISSPPYSSKCTILVMMRYEK